MAAQLVQMVTVVDKSGKAVKSSKHFVDAWKEAKAAYKERKAEVVANRYGSDRSSPRANRAIGVRDDLSHTSSRRHSKSQNPTRRRRSHEDYRSASGVSTPAPTSPGSKPTTPRSPSFVEVTRSAPTTPGLRRSITDRNEDVQITRPPPPPPRSYTSPTLTADEMGLAYGDLPGSLPLTTKNEEEEMQGLVGTAKRLLEEADCLHHSATKTIAMLQKNPEAMAAIALTLAEISTIAKKMAPGALASMSRGAPAVFGLLASPQFLIASGVAVGLTVVAFGGFKIIKQIKSKQAEPGMDEMLEINTDLSRIETWRRGIADEQASTIGTSVDGELITPQAAALSRLNLEDTGSPSRSKSHKKKHRSSVAGSDQPSRSSSRATSHAGSSNSKKSEASSSPKTKKEVKAKKPSPLRLMFR